MTNSHIITIEKTLKDIHADTNTIVDLLDTLVVCFSNIRSNQNFLEMLLVSESTASKSDEEEEV